MLIVKIQTMYKRVKRQVKIPPTLIVRQKTVSTRMNIILDVLMHIYTHRNSCLKYICIIQIYSRYIAINIISKSYSVLLSPFSLSNMCSCIVIQRMGIL